MAPRLLLLHLVSAATLTAQIYSANLPVGDYWTAPLNDPVSRLDKTARLDLPHLLERLGIPVDSQALVFSKTSFQASKISPRNPRAIYFNDDVAVAWIRGAASMEVAAVDPRWGVTFYSFEAGRFE